MDKHNIQGATPAKQARISIKAISEALTHSDIQITKTYVNTTETVNQTAGEIAFRSLKKQQGELQFFEQKKTSKRKFLNVCKR